MKYFAAEVDGEEKMIGSATDAKHFLRAHPEVETVSRYWWSRDDLIDVTEYTRAELLGEAVRTLEAGETAHWAQDHGRL